MRPAASQILTTKEYSVRATWALIGCFLTTAFAGTATAAPQIVMGAGPGSSPVVRVLTDTSDRTLQAYDPSFLGGVNVATGDMDGDGTPDIITGPGRGGLPEVRVFSGVDLHELYSFLAFNAGFSGGVSVAAGDFDGDGRDDIIVGA